METLLLERGGRLWLTGQAQLVNDESQLDTAAASTWKVERANPYVKWLAGNLVEADNPNSNRQFWTKGDLMLGEYSIKYAPLNMVHKVRQPVGFLAQTKRVELAKPKALKAVGADGAAEQVGSMRIQVLAGLWSHVFPFEAALVDQADEAGNLFISMECRGSHLHCAGPNGCDQTFDYMAADTHCEHLVERTSIRHIVNPVFRGAGVIVPPVKPGWKNAKLSVFQEAVLQEAAFLAEQTESVYDSLQGENPDLSEAAWLHLMASIVSLAGAE